MPLDIDMSRALRSHPELTALVDAIANAPASEQETEYLEWKSSFDLRGKSEHKFEVGKHVLGFANREPSRAAATFGGCAYIVLGVAPGSVGGVPVEDVADLTSWIGEYVGSDGPQWSTNYVERGGKDVLIVTVEAPQWGDNIFTLAKGFGSFREGALFTRRAGATVSPNGSEVRMLQERAARRSSRVSLNVELCDPETVLTTYRATGQDRVNWLNKERIRLEGGADRASPSSLGFSVDLRGRSGFEAECEDYFAVADKRWHSLLLEGAVRRELAPVRLCVPNPSEDNFGSVEVIVEGPDQAFIFFDEDGPEELLDPPVPPKPWGSHSMYPDIRVPRIAISSEGEIKKKGKHFEVVFAPFHLRPGRPHPLPPLFLALPQPFIGEVVTLAWEATSASAVGRATGTIDIPVLPEAVPAETLVPFAEQATG